MRDLLFDVNPQKGKKGCWANLFWWSLVSPRLRRPLFRSWTTSPWRFCLPFVGCAKTDRPAQQGQFREMVFACFCDTYISDSFGKTTGTYNTNHVFSIQMHCFHDITVILRKKWYLRLFSSSTVSAWLLKACVGADWFVESTWCRGTVIVQHNNGLHSTALSYFSLIFVYFSFTVIFVAFDKDFLLLLLLTHTHTVNVTRSLS